MILHETKFKNIIPTLLVSVLSALTTYFIFHNILKVGEFAAQILAVLGGIFIFYVIGRKIIVKHVIEDNQNVHIKFFLDPSKDVFLDNTQVDSFLFKPVNLGRYGKYEKAYIVLKNHDNHHIQFFTLKLEDETLSFWTNYRYPNKK